MVFVATDHTLWLTHTFGRNPLYEGSAWHRDLYLTTYHIHKRQTTMHWEGFEPVFPGIERPQTPQPPASAESVFLKCLINSGAFLICSTVGNNEIEVWTPYHGFIFQNFVVCETVLSVYRPWNRMANLVE